MNEEGEKYPVAVRIIAILFCVTAVLEGIFIFLFVFMPDTWGRFLNVPQIINILGQVSTILGVNLSPFGQISTVFGIILFGIAILTFLIGRGIWKLKEWARILTIAFGFIESIFSVIIIVNKNLTGWVICLVLSSIIPLYFLFSEKVKNAFD